MDCVRYLLDRGYRTFGDLGSLSSEQSRELELEVTEQSRPTLHTYVEAAWTARDGQRNSDECVVGLLRDYTSVGEETCLHDVAAFCTPARNLVAIEPVEGPFDIETERSIAEDIDYQLKILQISQVAGFDVDAQTQTITLIVATNLSEAQFHHIVHDLRTNCDHLPPSFSFIRDDDVSAVNLSFISCFDDVYRADICGEYLNVRMGAALYGRQYNESGCLETSMATISGVVQVDTLNVHAPNRPTGVLTAAHGVPGSAVVAKPSMCLFRTAIPCKLNLDRIVIGDSSIDIAYYEVHRGNVENHPNVLNNVEFHAADGTRETLSGSVAHLYRDNPFTGARAFRGANIYAYGALRRVRGRMVRKEMDRKRNVWIYKCNFDTPQPHDRLDFGDSGAAVFADSRDADATSAADDTLSATCPKTYTLLGILSQKRTDGAYVVVPSSYLHDSVHLV